MSHLYVITGFLGAGKTTFLKQFARMFQGQKLAILVNEFGKEDVDSLLLQELRARMSEIHNGSIFCACRLEQFEQALMDLDAEQPDVILVETSGLSDPTNVRKILSNIKRYENIEYMGCICLADALHFEKVLATANVCGKQLNMSDVVILNKTDLVDEKNLCKLEEQIRKIRPDVPIFRTIRGQVKPEWIEALQQPRIVETAPSILTRDVSLQSRLIVIQEFFPLDKLLEFLNKLAPSTYRIKGFARLYEATYLVDVVGTDVQATPWSGQVERPNRLVALAGQNLPMAATLENIKREYEPYIVTIE